MDYSRVLHRCKWARRDINSLRRQIEVTRELSVSISQDITLERVQTSRGSARFETIIARLDLLERTLEKQIEQYVADMLEAEATCRELPTSHALVMREYYLNGLTLERIAEETQMTLRHVTRLKSQALKMLEQR